MVKIKKFNLYLADLSPRFGTESGKVRPVVVVQTDMLNGIHPSTLICPITSQVDKKSVILRVFLKRSKKIGLEKDSEIMVDQVRAIDNVRFKKQLGKLDLRTSEKLLENLAVVLLE